METRANSLFQRIIATILCAVMLMTVLPAPAAATQTADGTVETVAPTGETEGVAQEAAESEWILPECDCGSTEPEIGAHGETCVRKVFLEKFCKETAAAIFAKWDQLPEECQKYILEYLSKDPADAEKLAELNGYVNAAETGSEDPTKETEDPTKETEDPTKETEDPTKETEDPTKETEDPTKETEDPTKETEESTDETEATEETEPEGAIFAISRNGKTPLAVVYAASDFQPKEDKFSVSQTVMENIINQMIAAGYTEVDGALLCGDYSNIGDTWNESETNAEKYNDLGVGTIDVVLKDEDKWGLFSNLNKLPNLKSKNNANDQVVYVQGNHDPVDTIGLDSFGANDTDDYGVFVIHEDYFQWYQKGTGDGNDDLGVSAEEAAKTTAEALRTYLQGKVDDKNNSPIFVASHVPLHYGYRTTADKKGDNVYAKYLFDVLNEYGKELTIIFLFGHNHSSTYDDYLGGGAVYLPAGDKIRIPNLGSTTSSTEYTLNFTYMNAGYLGYYGGNCTTKLSSTVFEIYEDEVVVARYGENGAANLKDKGVEDSSGLDPNETVYTNDSEKATIKLKKFTVDMDYSEVFNGTMSTESNSTLRIRGVWDVKYNVAWFSTDPSVVAVTPSNDGMSATLTAGKVGTAKITAVVTEAGSDVSAASVDDVSTVAEGDVNTFEYTISVVEDTSSSPMQLLPAGTFTYFKKVDNYVLGNTYMIVDMENDGPVIGQHEALELNRKPDYDKEQDEIYNSSRNVQELNASGQEVIQLPIAGNVETLILDRDRRNLEWEFGSGTKGTFIRTLNEAANSTTDTEGYLQRYLSASEGDQSDNLRTDYYSSDCDHDQLRMYHHGGANGGDTWLWDSNIGLYTLEKGNNFNYVLYYSQAQTDFSTYRYDVDGDTGLLTETADSRAYLFEKTTVTLSNPITAKLSDITGYVNKDVGYTDDEGLRRGGVQTGDNILITDGTKTHSVPVTIDMLRGTFNVTAPGTYNNLQVVYAGVELVNNYTLVVRNSATLLKNDAAREYMDTIYTLVDEMLPNRQYLIVDTDEEGIAHAMGVTDGLVTAHNVRVQNLPVDGKKLLLIDSSRYSTDADPVVSGLTGRGIEDQGNINAYLYDTVTSGSSDNTLKAYEAAIRLVWSATQRVFPYQRSPGDGAAQGEFYNAASSGHKLLEHEYSNEYLSINGAAKDQTLKLIEYPESGSNTSYLYWRSQWQYDNEGLHLDTPDTSSQTYKYDEAYIFYNWQNVDANNSTSNAANKNFQNAVSEYTHTDKNTYDLTGLRRTWIYERVTNIDTISARISDKSATVPQYVTGKNESTTGATFLKDYILVDTVHANGTVTTQQVPITISMLSGNFDLTVPKTYPNLTVTYQGVPVCTDYNLIVQEFVPNNYPEFPNEGAVRIEKQLDTSKYVYTSTGVASIDLSVTGIPAQTGVDLVIILDASSSMSDCVHAVDRGENCTACGGLVAESASRMAQLENTLQNMLTELKTPIDGYIPDIDVAVATFNGYTVINSSYELWNSTNGNASHDIGQEANEDKPDASEILYNFTNISKIDPAAHNPTTGMDITINRGTNYDRAMELAYDLLKEKQEKNAKDNVSRDAIVVFMSDGAPFQFNYIQGDPNLPFWNAYLIGDNNDAALQIAIGEQPTAVQTMYNLYNGSGKHWTAEAIKAPVTKADNKMIDPDANTVNQIVQVRGLGATMYTIGYGLGDDNRVTKETCQTVLRNMATSSDHFILADNDDQLHKAFTDITGEIRRAGNAVFTDQMGPMFNLVTSKEIKLEGTDDTITLTPEPSITVKQYELYKRSELGTIVDGVEVTTLMIGERKNTNPDTLETVTFNEDGTAAYSDQKPGQNILDGKIIKAATFFYNTDLTNAHDITVGEGENAKTVSLAPETFYWIVGDVPLDELVLSYSVYLEGSMEGTRPQGSYDTNNYAKLNYTNYLGNPCELSVPSPKLPWGQGTVAHAFYLVDKDGNPIINQTTGEIGSFEQSIEITQPVYTDFLLNSDGKREEGKAVATDVLPEGYALFDPGAVYTVTLASDGTGTYEVIKGDGVTRATTYIQGLGPTDINPVGLYTTENYATANTIVWFAVYATVQAVPDTVVVDFGLPVDIDVLANENMMGTTVSLEHIARADLAAISEGYNAAKVKDPGLKLWEHLQGLGKTEIERPFTTTSADGDFGTIAINTETVNGVTKNTGKVRYTMNTENGMQMDKEDTFVYAVKYTGSIGTPGYYYSTVTVIPATTIYYEDSFVSFSVYDFDSDAVVTNFTGNYSNNKWTPVTASTVPDDPTQDQDRPGEFSFPNVDANNIYGHDGAYTDMATYSLGSAMKVTVDRDVYARAQFTFNGTGFDVISLTSKDTGTIMVSVYDAAAYSRYLAKEISLPNPVQYYMVDTYYGYKYADGQWVADPGSEEILYQVPVMKVSGLTYGKYTAVITATYKSGLDHNKTEGSSDNYDFYLDAIRIYDPANDGITGVDENGNKIYNDVIKDAYVDDHEGWPEYFELRNQIIAETDFNALEEGKQTTGIIFIDDTANTNSYSVSDYTNYGPNNELYLAPGQSISFDLNVPDDEVKQTDGTYKSYPVGIHLAMKSVSGTVNVEYYNVTSNETKVQINNDKTMTVATATDLYYDITDLNGNTVVISNTGGSILSITNIKVTHQVFHEDLGFVPSGYFTINKDGAEAAVASLMMMRPPVTEEPEETVPEETVPETTVPEETVPETTVPEETVPETTVPEETVPETTVPEETVPETTVPEEPEEPEIFEPKKFSVKLSDSSVKVGSKVTVTVTTGTDVDYITVNGTKVTKYSGSWFSSTRTWQVRVEAEEVGQMDVAVVCCNSEGLASQPIVKTVTVTEQYTSITNVVKDLVIGFFDRLWGSR